ALGANHLNFSAPRLYLGSGVTTIRTTGSFLPYGDISLKHDIERGESPGPRMHVTGPYINGPSTWGFMSTVASAEDARRVVHYRADEGVTWSKVYQQISRDQMATVIEEAHKRGLKVTGHLCSVTYREAVALGIDQLEHGLLTNTDYDPQKTPDVCPPDFRSRM